MFSKLARNCPLLLTGGLALAAVDNARAPGPCEPAWESTFGGWQATSSAVRALTIFDDGSGPALYVGGAFDTARGRRASRTAKWDGQSWSPVGSGIGNTVNAFAVFHDGTGPVLVAGRVFTSADGLSANRVVQWDGSAWSPLGARMNHIAVERLTLAPTGPISTVSFPRTI